MPDSMQTKLGAYLDGELAPFARKEVEEHLKSCEACQQELADLRQLSQDLQSLLQTEFVPSQDFRAQVMEQIDRLPDNRQADSALRKWLWMLPVLVLFSLIFIEVTFTVTNFLTFIQQTGWVQGSYAWMLRLVPQIMQWLAIFQSSALGILLLVLLKGLQTTNFVGLVLNKLVILFILQFVAGGVYWASLALAAGKGFQTSPALHH